MNSSDLPITLEHEEATSALTITQEGAGTAHDAACTVEATAARKKRVVENHISDA